VHLRGTAGGRGVSRCAVTVRIATYPTPRTGTTRDSPKPRVTRAAARDERILWPLPGSHQGESSRPERGSQAWRWSSPSRRRSRRRHLRSAHGADRPAARGGGRLRPSPFQLFLPRSGPARGSTCSASAGSGGCRPTVSGSRSACASIRHGAWSPASTSTSRCRRNSREVHAALVRSAEQCAVKKHMETAAVQRPDGDRRLGGRPAGAVARGAVGGRRTGSGVRGVRRCRGRAVFRQVTAAAPPRPPRAARRRPAGRPASDFPRRPPAETRTRRRSHRRAPPRGPAPPAPAATGSTKS